MIVKVIGDGITEPRRPDLPENIGYSVVQDLGDLMEVRLDAGAQQEMDARATKAAFTALAMTGAITDEVALDNRYQFDLWEEHIGKEVLPGTCLRYDTGLVRVVSTHTVQAHYPPSVHTASLYTRIMPPNEGPEAWMPGQSYAIDVEVTHNGGVWQSKVDNNTWEPGGPGVYDNVWKRVRDA